jgi:hypothetical protein
MASARPPIAAVGANSARAAASSGPPMRVTSVSVAFIATAGESSAGGSVCVIAARTPPANPPPGSAGSTASPTSAGSGTRVAATASRA